MTERTPEQLELDRILEAELAAAPDSTSPFRTESIECGTYMPHRRRRYVELPPEWAALQVGSLVVDANSEEQTFKILEFYTERDGQAAVICADSTGTRRYLYRDALRLASLGGRGKSRGRRGVSLLSDAEQKLSRAEKRKLRRERRAGTDSPL